MHGVAARHPGVTEALANHWATRETPSPTGPGWCASVPGSSLLVFLLSPCLPGVALPGSPVRRSGSLASLGPHSHEVAAARVLGTASPGARAEGWADGAEDLQRQAGCAVGLPGPAGPGPTLPSWLIPGKEQLCLGSLDSPVRMGFGGWGRRSGPPDPR